MCVEGGIFFSESISVTPRLLERWEYTSASPTKTVEKQHRLLQRFQLISLSKNHPASKTTSNEHSSLEIRISSKFQSNKQMQKTISKGHWLQFVLWMLAHISICTVAMPRSLGCMPKYWIYGLIQSKLFVGVSMVLPVINKVEC